MQIQHGHVISNKWIPKGENTGFVDIDGIELKTGDWVSIAGCKESEAVIGKTIPEFLERQPKWLLLFATEDATVQWFLNERTIAEHEIRKL